jgi:hypothetical protein
VLALAFPVARSRFGAVTHLLTALAQIVASHLSASHADVLLPRSNKNQEEEIMAKTGKNDATKNLSPAKEALRNLWVEHVRYEFCTRSTGDTLATMVDDAYVNHVPVLTGGSGRDEFLPIGQ